MAYREQHESGADELTSAEAEVVGKGILKNYELLFRGAKARRQFATVETAGRKQCSVVLWEIGAQFRWS